MGEYVEDFKLGTCESLYYVRYQDVKQIASIHPQAKTYLDHSKGWLYRFPFPDEDKTSGLFPNYENPYNYGLEIFVPHDTVESDPKFHNEICHSINMNGGHNINVFNPCPYSEDFKNVKHSHDYDEGLFHKDSQDRKYRVIKIRFIKFIQNGGGWVQDTVFECGYCGSMFRVGAETKSRIKDFIAEKHIKQIEFRDGVRTEVKSEFWQEVYNRIE
jgi:hypothetical protein